MGRIILVTGGARSGKSAFAERYAVRCAQENSACVAYIATAQIYDEEMRQRVKLHQSRRPSAWTTYEAPFEAAAAIQQAGKEHGVLLFDCVTMFLSNHILQCSEERQKSDAFVDYVKECVEGLIQAAISVDAVTIFVTNEVGAGIVPENRLARLYRDMAGLVNQKLAHHAACVYLVACGLAVDLKKIAEEI